MPVSVGNRFLLLYGSQTGQAQAIAEEIAEKAGNHGLHADIQCLSGVEKKFHIEREKCVVIVTSTTGDGEAPDTALKFFRRLKKKTLPKNYLSSLNYALLGLGDSNYTNFCNCGKNVDRRLQELGAHHFYDSGWADDATGLEVVVEPWIDGLWVPLKSFLKLPIAEHDHINNSITNLPTGQNSVSNGTNGITALPIDLHVDSVNGVNKNSSQSSLTNTNNSRSDSKENTNQSNSNLSSGKSSPPDTDREETRNQSNSDLNIKPPDNKSLQENLETKKDKSSAIVTEKKEISNVPQTASSSNSQNDSAKSAGSCDQTNSSVGGGEAGLTGSVRVSVPPLSESSLTVPLLPPPYLKIDYVPDQTLDLEILPRQNGCDFPSAASTVSMTKVKYVKTLTIPSALKTTLAIELDVQDSGLSYQPGDAFSVICPNPAGEVDNLLARLEVQHRADMSANILVIDGTKKRNAAVPKWVPTACTLRYIFQTCLDIREPPKKALLRVLVEYTSNESEKRRLQELCSKKGSGDYTCYIREPSLSILDILHHFPGCHPPVERLVEHLPRLQPRPYSICSSPLRQPHSILFVFNIVEMPPDSGRSYHRTGVCTGWLDEMRSNGIQKSEAVIGETGADNLAKEIEDLSLSNFKIPIFARTNQNFHMPDDVTVPLILIGPGTGVAPFIGYLDHRAELRQQQPEAQYEDIWLFYGCRNQDRDYLFREQLENHLSSSTLSKLLVSYSRDIQPEGAPRYVQDNIRSHGDQLVNLLDEKGAMIYVCGDAKNMAKDVNEAFAEIYSKEKGISVDDGRKVMMKLRLDRRYKEDVWT